MEWYIWWGISAGILLATWVGAVVLSLVKYKRKRVLTPNRLLFAGTFVSALVYFIRVYHNIFDDPLKLVDWSKSILAAIQHSFRLFALDGGYLEFINRFENLPGDMSVYYSVLGAVLYAFAPMLTFGFILHFFKNASAFRRYYTSFWMDTHVFSELNEKSLALAKSIAKKGRANRLLGFIPKVLIVFTDVHGGDDERSVELMEQAKELGAVMFRKSMESIKYRGKRSLRRLSFYLISDNETEKYSHADSIINGYNYTKTKLYIFTSTSDGGCFYESYTDEVRKMRIEVIRVNDIRMLIYHDLDVNGIRLFEKAVQKENGERTVSALIVGLGRYGIEMVKALLWYCQIPGYSVKITVIDELETSNSVFQAMCPGIKLGETVDDDGDMKYFIDIHNAKAGTKEFADKVKSLDDVTYVFVCMGDDKMNISTAKEIRCLMGQQGLVPDIETVVYESDLKRRTGISWSDEDMCLKKTDMANYNIHAIGDLDSFYSEGTVIASDLIIEGFNVHKRWDKSENAEMNYYMSDYNFSSSIASALHRNLRKKIADYQAKKEVFPRFCIDGECRCDSKQMIMNKVLNSINSTEEIVALSDRMYAFAVCLYTIIGWIRYSKLDSDKKEVCLTELRGKTVIKDGNENKLSESAKKEIYCLTALVQSGDGMFDMLTEFLESKCRVSGGVGRMFYEAVSKVSGEAVEYGDLTDNEKETVREYVKRVCSDIDIEIEEMLDWGRCFAEIEHVRWNAYTRTEGFVYAKADNKRYKQHHNLVPTDDLTFYDCVKDI